MKRLIGIFASTALLLACQSGGFKPVLTEIEPCDCEPPPYKTIPEERITELTHRFEIVSQLINTLTPPKFGIAESNEEGHQRIKEQCILLRKAESPLGSLRTKEYVLAVNKSKNIYCPVSYRAEIDMLLNTQQRTAKGLSTTTFSSELGRTMPQLLNIKSIHLLGPYFRKVVQSKENSELHTLSEEYSQEGFIDFFDMGKISTKVIGMDSKQVFIDSTEGRTPGQQISEKYYIFYIAEENVVFHWKRVTDLEGQNPVVNCELNGTEISESSLCENFQY